jgi:hypothetical protein
VNPKFEKRLQLAAALVVVGLLAQVLTMFWNHPLAFVAFIAVATPIAGLGVLVYLVALIRE